MGDQDCSTINPCKTRKKNSRLWFNKSSKKKNRNHQYFTSNYNAPQGFDQANSMLKSRLKIPGIKFRLPLLENNQYCSPKLIYASKPSIKQNSGGKAISDSASQKRPFSTGRSFDWNLLVLLIVSRVNFIVFVLFLEAVGVREYCFTAVEIGWQLCASRFLRDQRPDEPSSQRFSGFGLGRKPPKATFVELHSAESRQSYSRRNRCWQHGIDTARCWRRVMHAAGEGNKECTTLTCCEKQQQQQW